MRINPDNFPALPEFSDSVEGFDSKLPIELRSFENISNHKIYAEKVGKKVYTAKVIETVKNDPNAAVSFVINFGAISKFLEEGPDLRLEGRQYSEHLGIGLRQQKNDLNALLTEELGGNPARSALFAAIEHQEVRAILNDYSARTKDIHASIDRFLSPRWKNLFFVLLKKQDSN